MISILLVCLMAFSSVPLLFGNYASATTGAANFLPNTFVTGLDTWNESSISMGTQQQISSLLSSRYPSRVITDVNTTIYTFNSKLSFVQSSYDKVVVFSKGHRGVPAPGHVSLVDYGGLISNQITDYNEIFPKTSSKNTVTFIWHCQTAYPYNPGGVNFDSSYRACGMPFSWTHNNNMGYYGTSGDQVYLGWNERDPLKIYDFSLGDTKNVTVMGGTKVHSPQYEWYTNPTYNYAHVAYLFWSNMCSGKSTIESLDSLSNTIYGRSFTAPDYADNDLNHWLIVLGNQNSRLPP